MKKIIALIMAMLLSFSCAAFAEETVIEISYEGAWVEMEYGLGMYVPADWYIAELNEQQIEKGIFAYFGNEDVTETLQIAATAIDENTTYEALYAGLSQVYTDVQFAELPNMDVITYADYEKGLFAALTIDEANGILYTFNFVSNSEEFGLKATEILCTFGYISFEE